MMSQADKERKNKQVGAIISIGSHVLVFLLFLFMVAWRAPNPPLPEIGIELNFGLDDAGSGADQPTPFTTPTDSNSEEEVAPDGTVESPEDVVEEHTESPTEPTKSEDIPVEELNTPTTQTQESPDVVEEKTEPAVKEVVETETVTKQEDTQKSPPILYPNNKTGVGGKDGMSKEAQDANQGDKPEAVGDQGDSDGTIDSRALYGVVGGGGGSSLRMSGWMWDFKPNPKDTSSESGKLVFQVVIDDRGAIIRVKTIESSVSPSLEKIYRDEVMKLTFSKTAGTSVASSSTGTITFVIKAR